MNEEQQLMAIMASAIDQQTAVWTAIESLKIEREALAKERAAMTQAVAAMTSVAAEASKAASNAIPGMRRAAGEAVGEAIAKSLAEVSGTTQKALMEAISPTLEAASHSASSLERASKWFAWKWVASATVLIAAVSAIAWASVTWQLHQKGALQAEIAELQNSVNLLERRGGRLVTSNCGGHLCIEAKSDGSGWTNKETGAQLFIPRNY